LRKRLILSDPEMKTKKLYYDCGCSYEFEVRETPYLKFKSSNHCTHHYDQLMK